MDKVTQQHNITLIAQKKAHLHPYNTIIVVARNMKPCAWIYKRWVPALQYIVWIL